MKLIFFVLIVSYSTVCFSQNCHSINDLIYYKAISLGYPLSVELKNDLVKAPQFGSAQDTSHLGINRSILKTLAPEKYEHYNEWFYWGKFFDNLGIDVVGKNEVVYNYYFFSEKNVENVEEAIKLKYDFLVGVIGDLLDKFGETDIKGGFNTNDGQRIEYMIWKCEKVKLTLKQTYTSKSGIVI